MASSASLCKVLPGAADGAAWEPAGAGVSVLAVVGVPDGSIVLADVPAPGAPALTPSTPVWLALAGGALTPGTVGKKPAGSSDEASALSSLEAPNSCEIPGTSPSTLTKPTGPSNLESPVKS